MTKVAVIVAMERELHPLVDGWAKKSFAYAGKTFRGFESGACVAVAGGIGCRCSETAARAVIETFHPQALISAGLAGALVPGLRAGSIVRPEVIVDGTTGTEYRCRVPGLPPGEGVLVSSPEIAGPESKERLARRFHALAVDMEAAGVAKAAREHDVAFDCVKAVSDARELALPPLNAFVDADGNFQVARFGAWAALRPWYWVAICKLAHDTGRATRVLSDWLGRHLASNFLDPTLVTLSEARHFKNSNANCQQS